MLYRAIGLMSGSSLDGLDIVFAELHENAGKWTYEILQSDCYPYTADWIQRLQQATSLSALDYQLLHVDYGHYLGQQVNRFIDTHQLHYKVALVASHGHTTFHVPGRNMTAQLGEGASIAAETQLPVVSDLRAMDLAFGGQGAPIVPIGEKLLLGNYAYFLNLGGIANVSINRDAYTAFDICPANRVLNMLVAALDKSYDDGGAIARTGTVQQELLEKLNQLDYYSQPYPKSLANDFGTDVVYPIIKGFNCSIPDALRTYTEHIAIQIKRSIEAAGITHNNDQKLLATGGGAFNTLMVDRIQEHLQSLRIEVVVPEARLINYKEALVMALMGVLRWRQEYNVLSSVTGSARDSIGGALWTGQEA